MGVRNREKRQATLEDLGKGKKMPLRIHQSCVGKVTEEGKEKVRSQKEEPYKHCCITGHVKKERKVTNGWGNSK